MAFFFTFFLLATFGSPSLPASSASASPSFFLAVFRAANSNPSFPSTNLDMDLNSLDLSAVRDMQDFARSLAFDHHISEIYRTIPENPEVY